MMKGTADHVQLEVGKALETNQMAVKLPAAACDVHRGKAVEVFCQDCKMAVCVLCFIEAHQGHTCCDVEDLCTSLVLNKEVRADTDQVIELMKKTRELLPCFELKKDYLVSRLADIEEKINSAAYKLIDAVQLDRQELLSEVQSIRVKRMKQLETVKEELEQHMAALESFRRYSETLLSSGTACDVTRSAKSLHDRAEELMNNDVIGQVQSSLMGRCSAAVKFCHKSPTTTNKTSNLVGEINEAAQTAIVGRFRFDLPVFGQGQPGSDKGLGRPKTSGHAAGRDDSSGVVARTPMVVPSAASFTAFSGFWSPKPRNVDKTARIAHRRKF